MERLRQYDPPIVVDRIVSLPATTADPVPPAGSPGAALQGCCEVTGHYSCFDIYVQAPVTWLDVTFRVTTQTGPITTPVELRALRDARLFFTAQDVQVGGLGSVDGFLNVLLFSIRGRQCSHLALEAYRTAFNHGQAKFYIQAWGADGIYGDRATVLPVQPFGDITQQLRAAQQLEDIETEDIEFVDNLGTPQVVNPTGGRIDVTRITISHEEEVPVLYTLTTFNEGTGSEVEALFLVHPGTNYVEEFTYPLRGRPSARWRITPDAFSGGGVRHVVNTIGILE